MQRRKEVFNPLVFGPEVAMRHSYIGDRTLQPRNVPSSSPETGNQNRHIEIDSERPEAEDVEGMQKW
jgi:hypothetical protein